MPRPRKNSAPTVALFQFLDVLMCTIGALILMLLVAGTKTRGGVFSLERSHPQPVAVVAVTPALPEAAKPLPPPPPLFIPSPEPEFEPEEEEPEEIDTGPTWEDYAREETALRAEWERRLAELKDQLARARTQLQSLQDKSAAMEAECQELKADIERGQTDREKSARRREHLAASQKKLLADRQETQDKIAELEQRLLDLQAARANRSSKYSVITYNGMSGTARRPVILECHADRITFAAEDISLTPAQLSGFTPEINPLKSGAATLAALTQDIDPAKGGEFLKPYVLFLVRPNGTEAFYVARGLLGDLPSGHGVELLTDEMELTWPPAEPGEVAALEQAINLVLEQRSRVAAAYRAGGSRPMNFTGAAGGFHLAEADSLRSSGKSPNQKLAAARPNGNTTTGAPGGSSGDALQRSTPPQLDAAPAPGSPRPTEAGEEEPTGTFDAEGTPRPPRGLVQGQASGAPSSSPPQRRRGPLQPPEVIDDELPTRRNTYEPEELSTRRWGVAQPAARIGFEHKLTVHVFSDRLSAGDELVVQLPEGVTRDDVQQALAALIEAAARSWGKPPANFYWLPNLTLKIHPGGNIHTARLKGLAEAWGLRVSLESVLE